MSPCPLQAFESTERYWCVAVLFDPPQIDNDAGLAQGRATALYLIVCIKGPLGRIPAWIGEMSPVKVGRVADVPSLPGRIKAALQKEDGDKQPSRERAGTRGATRFILPSAVGFLGGLITRRENRMICQDQIEPHTEAPCPEQAALQPTTDEGSPQLGSAGAVHF